MAQQSKLSSDSIAEFYHDWFVEQQVASFCAMVGPTLSVGARVIDLGGGVGYFAAALKHKTGVDVRVVDMDAESARRCGEIGITAVLDDAITTRAADGAELATLNMILHHLVGSDFHSTEVIQIRALANLAQAGGPARVFVNEFIYEGLVAPNLSGALIFRITASRALSSIASTVARLIPSLRANTFGVGVRFRAAEDWGRLFARAGWRVSQHHRGTDNVIGVARRLMLALRSWRCDSFLLERVEQT